MNLQEIKKLTDKIDNIKRVTAQLGIRSKTFADYVSGKMYDAGITSLLGGDLTINTIKTNVGNDEILSIDGGGDLLSSNIEANGGYYLHGDFSAWIQYTNRCDVVAFIDRIPEILAELSKLGELPELPELPELVELREIRESQL